MIDQCRLKAAPIYLNAGAGPGLFHSHVCRLVSSDPSHGSSLTEHGRFGVTLWMPGRLELVWRNTLPEFEILALLPVFVGNHGWCTTQTRINICASVTALCCLTQLVICLICFMFPEVIRPWVHWFMSLWVLVLKNHILYTGLETLSGNSYGIIIDRDSKDPMIMICI